MDLGDNHNYNMHPRINGDPQRGNSNTVSLLDLPNSTIDDTSILTPTALNMDRHSHHTTLMDTQARNTSTSNNTPNSTTKLSTNYHQTRAARRAQQQQEIHNLDTGTTTSCKQTTYSSFDEEHDISKLFLASRNNTNNNQHQNLASSFDPSDKTCTICTTTHNILTPSNQAPLTLIISDQGFPGVLSGGDCLCVKTIRIEDGTVTELADLFIEIFQGSILPNSTILLLGSVTSMLQQGSSGYLFDWLACAKKIGGRWGNIKVCPLPPLWGGSLPGKMHRTLLEIDSAFEMLYGSDPRGLRSAWRALVERLKASNNLTASKNLVPESYTLPYPAKLSGPISVKNRTFVTDVSSPASLDPVSRTAKTEFVRLLAAELKSSLSAGFDPAVISARIDESGREAEAQDKNSISPPPLCGFWI